MNDRLKEMLYYLITGFRRWNNDFSQIPWELHRGHMMFIRYSLEQGNTVPNNLYDLLHLVKKPCRQWGTTGIEQIFPPEAGLLEEFTGLTEEAEEFMEEIVTLRESQQRVMLEILQYCRDMYREDPQYAQLYSNIRAFVSKKENAVIPYTELSQFALDVDDKELSKMCFQLYEQIEVPMERFRKCPYCNWTLEYFNGQWKCNDSTCRYLGDFTGLKMFQAEYQQFYRLTPGIQKFVLLPGMAELHIYNRLKNFKHKMELYPEVDQVDIRVYTNQGPIDIDVKDYKSPYNLVHSLNNTDFEKYTNKIYIVIPNYRRELQKGFIDILNSRLNPEIKSKLEIVWEEQLIKNIKKG